MRRLRGGSSGEENSEESSAFAPERVSTVRGLLVGSGTMNGGSINGGSMELTLGNTPLVEGRGSANHRRLGFSRGTSFPMARFPALA